MSVRLPWMAGPPLLCRWDLDKTYLRSDFDTLRQLWRTAWERAEDKVEVPGVPAVVKALRVAAERQGRACRIYFVSASPPQMGKVVRDKLALDGVPYDGIVFKNQLEHIRRGRFRNLREHVGFKLAELLKGRRDAPPGTEELLFGDDWESDPLIYSMYADLMAGTLTVEALPALLGRLGVDPEAVPTIVALAREMRRGSGRVRRIFINLARRTPPGRFDVYGTRVVPTYNYFQTAAVLAAEGIVGANDVADVARELAGRAGYDAVHFENSLADLVRRRAAPTRRLRRLGRSLVALGYVPRRIERRSISRWYRRRRRERRRVPPPTAHGGLDYETILATFPRLARGQGGE